MPAFLLNGLTPESLGVSVASRTLRSLAPGTLRLHVVDAALVQSRLYNFADSLTLTADGRKVFTGRIIKEVPHRGEKKWGRQIEVKDLLWDLAQITFTQLWDGAESRALTLGAYGTADKTGRLSHNTVNSSGQATISTGMVIRDVLAHAQQKGLSFNYNLHGIGHEMIPHNLSSRHSLEVIQHLTQWMPGLVSWVDYTTTPVTLHFAEAHLLQTFGGTNTLAWPISQTQLCEFDPQDDLRLSEVNLYYEEVRTGKAVISSSVRAAVAGDVAPAGHINFHLPDGSTWDTTATGTGYNSQGKANAPLPQYLHQTLLDRWSRRYYNGSLSYIQADPLSAEYMGNLLNVMGGPPEWQTMQAVVIEQTDDLQTGRGSLKAGINRHLLVQPHRIGRIIKPLAQAARNEPKTSPAAVSHEPLECYVLEQPSNVWRVYVNVGTLNPGDTGPLCPKMTTGLNPITHVQQFNPIASMSRGQTPLNVWLRVEMHPNTEPYDLVDADNTHFTEYRATSGGIISLAQFGTTQSATAQPPLVSPLDGSILQEGRFYFLWAVVSWPADATEPTVQSLRKGSKDLLLVPPNRLLLTTQA